MPLTKPYSFRPPVKVAARRRRPAALVVMVALVVTVLVASWVIVVLPMENAETTVDLNTGKLVQIPVKPNMLYAAEGLAIGSVFAAGALAALMGGFGALGIGVRAAFCVLFANTAIWAAVAYSGEELISVRILGATGPFVWFTLAFIPAGLDRRIWTYIDPVLRALAYASAGLALRTLATSKFQHFAGFSIYTMYAQLLMWLGGWTLLTATGMSGLRLLARSVPLLVGLGMAICSQSRSWTGQCCLAGLVFLLLRSREQGSIVSGVRNLIVAGGLCATVAAVLYFVVPHTMGDSLSGLSDRLGEDTRTNQYRDFFAVVPVQDLVLGRGPKGTWFWRGFGDFQYFDNAYLWMLFVGGVPTLVCYLTLVVWPAIRALSYRPRGADAGVACLLLLWALALAGFSTFTLPGYGFNSFLMSLCAGRCHLLSAEKRRLLVTRPRIVSTFRAAGLPSCNYR